jgi:hypothetical protein
VIGSVRLAIHAIPVKWLNNHKFTVHMSAFFLMILPPIPLYFAAQQGAIVWSWVLLAIVVLGNLLAISIR